MHLLEDSAAGIAAVIQSVEPLLESARLESVLAGKLGSGQVAGVEKLDELSALRGGVIRATSRSMIIHPQSLSPRTHLREDLLGLTLTIVLSLQFCLSCHGQPGTDIKPEVLAQIKTTYPADTATGFKLGQVRGLWSVDFKRSDFAAP